MEKPKNLPLSQQELIDRAARIFDEERIPKFPTVREKFLTGIRKPETEVFLSSFDHLNPDYPSRIITGKLRASGIAEALKTENVRAVTILIDTLSPREDAEDEGGGWELGLGINSKKMSACLFADKNIIYEKNTLIALDTDTILSNFFRGLGQVLADIKIPPQQKDIYKTQMCGRLGTILALYNLAITDGIHNQQSTPQILNSIRKKIEQYINMDEELYLKEILQSKLIHNMALGIEELATQGFPFWKMPLGTDEHFFRFLSEDGKKAAGKVFHEGTEFIFRDWAGQEIKRIPQNEIFAEMQKGCLLPTGRLTMMIALVASEIPHFGNTYGLEQHSLEWLGIDGTHLRIGGDYTNSIPVGNVTFRGKTFTNMPIALLHFPPEKLRDMIRRTVKEGQSQFTVPFGNIETS